MSLSGMMPTGSQTVGPYFRIGLEYLVGQESANDSKINTIEIRGRILDGNASPVSDGMLEFWGADTSGTTSGVNPNSRSHPIGFHRVATDSHGTFSLLLNKPVSTGIVDGRPQAPHMLVLIFARGLLRHLITRVYFDDESANTADPVLLEIPAERQHTLVARCDANNPRVFHWNVILQGDDETAFFAW